MLMTMEHECKRECQLFPSPERIDKVEESMANLEVVVRERNRAYHQLETGLSGEIPGAEEENFLGLEEYRQFQEHIVPKDQNKPYLIAQRDAPKASRKEKSWFLVRWKEKQRRQRRKTLKLHQFEVIQLLQKFPDLDVEALKEKYPDVNVDKYVTRFLKEKHQGNKKVNTSRKIDRPYAIMW
jgi:large subunit ribosomal protein L47